MAEVKAVKDVVLTIACVLAKLDGYDPEDERGGLYDVRWSGGSQPEPMGDAWQMDYMPRAEQIAEALGYSEQSAINQESALAALREEVERYKVAWEEYNERTQWVQQTVNPRELGMHRADVLRLRIEQAEADNARLLEALKQAKKWIVGVPIGEPGREEFEATDKAIRAALAKKEGGE